jgi:hypothetical protein
MNAQSATGYEATLTTQPFAFALAMCVWKALMLAAVQFIFPLPTYSDLQRRERGTRRSSSPSVK